MKVWITFSQDNYNLKAIKSKENIDEGKGIPQYQNHLIDSIVSVCKNTDSASLMLSIFLNKIPLSGQ